MSEADRRAIATARARSAATMRHWRESAPYRATEHAFADCAGCAERTADRAERLLADGDWAAGLLTPLVDALAGDPWFEPAIRFHRDGRRVGIVLFDCPAVSIATSVASLATGAAAPRTIVFTGRRAVTRIVRAGGAQLQSWHTLEPGDSCDLTAARCARSDTRLLEDGAVYRTDGRTEARMICDAAGDVVTLVATIRAGAAPLMREYDIATGALVRVADADDRPSRTAMLLRFLRVAGKADAADCFDAATRAPAFHLRWAAMREWLALDAARAAPRLAEMAAADPSAEVRSAAARMLPAIDARLHAAQCPA